MEPIQAVNAPKGDPPRPQRPKEHLVAHRILAVACVAFFTTLAGFQIAGVDSKNAIVAALWVAIIQAGMAASQELKRFTDQSQPPGRSSLAINFMVV